MLFLLFKIIAIVCVVYAYHMVPRTVPLAAVWSAVVLFTLALSGQGLVWIVVGTSVALLMAIGYFTLLEHLEERSGYWPALILGGVVLVFVP